MNLASNISLGRGEISDERSKYSVLQVYFFYPIVLGGSL